MQKHLYCYPICVLSLFIGNCKGQNPAIPPTQTEIASPLIQDPTDYDPYFTETVATTSAFGPKSITRNVLQDRKGDFWMSSWEGIIQFDGKTFTNLTNRDGLRRYHMFSLLEDSKGKLWFGSIGAGVYCYDGKTFTNYTSKEGLVGDRVGYIYEDKQGNIWIGTNTGISRYDGKTFHNLIPSDEEISRDVTCILEDKSGKIWFGTRGAACFYDGKSFHKVLKTDGTAFNNVWSIIEDKNGNVWLGGQCGLWRYDGTVFANYSDAFVGDLCEDRNGNLWACAGEPDTHKMALYRYDGISLSVAGIPPTPHKILSHDGQIYGIIEDKNGNILFGTDKGVCRYDGKSFNWWRE
jgi:ligand-binding sensor domain-containing protein